VDTPHNGSEEFKSQRWNNLSTGRREYKEQLVPLNVRKLNALALLHRRISGDETKGLGFAARRNTYKERFLLALLVLRERVLDSNLG